MSSAKGQTILDFAESRRYPHIILWARLSDNIRAMANTNKHFPFLYKATTMKYFLKHILEYIYINLYIIYPSFHKLVSISSAKHMMRILIRFKTTREIRIYVITCEILRKANMQWTKCDTFYTYCRVPLLQGLLFSVDWGHVECLYSLIYEESDGINVLSIFFIIFHE